MAHAENRGHWHLQKTQKTEELKKWGQLKSKGRGFVSFIYGRFGNACLYNPNFVKSSRFLTALRLRRGGMRKREPKHATTVWRCVHPTNDFPSELQVNDRGSYIKVPLLALQSSIEIYHTFMNYNATIAWYYSPLQEAASLLLLKFISPLFSFLAYNF